MYFLLVWLCLYDDIVSVQFSMLWSRQDLIRPHDSRRALRGSIASDLGEKTPELSAWLDGVCQMLSKKICFCLDALLAWLLRITQSQSLCTLCACYSSIHVRFYSMCPHVCVSFIIYVCTGRGKSQQEGDQTYDHKISLVQWSSLLWDPVGPINCTFLCKGHRVQRQRQVFLHWKEGVETT